jgi:hypothetical protein
MHAKRYLAVLLVAGFVLASIPADAAPRMTSFSVDTTTGAVHAEGTVGNGFCRHADQGKWIQIGLDITVSYQFQTWSGGTKTRASTLKVDHQHGGRDLSVSSGHINCDPTAIKVNTGNGQGQVDLVYPWHYDGSFGSDISSASSGVPKQLCSTKASNFNGNCLVDGSLRTDIGTLGCTFTEDAGTNYGDCVS